MYMKKTLILLVLKSVAVALCVTALVSSLIHLIPGDPVDQILGDFASLEEKEQLRERLGLSLPLFVQFFSYISGIMKGDLGNSLIYGRPVFDMLIERFPSTVELALLSMSFALAFSLPLGLMSAKKIGTWLDHVIRTASLIGIAIPNFWLGPLLIIVFSLKLNLLPVSEKSTLISYILPALTLGMALSAFLTRITRSSLVSTLNADYIRTARAKGASEWDVFSKHALKNALLPVVTVSGLQLGVLMTGAIITEKIFDWPGVGSLLLEGIHNRDYPIVQSAVLMFSLTYITINLVTDTIYGWIDPRIQRK